MSILTNDFRIENARNFYDNSLATDLYLCFARTEPWPNDSNGKSEADTGFIVPAPDAYQSPVDFRNELIVGVRLTGDDVMPVIPRVNWATNTTYNYGDVVITDEFNVYRATATINSNTKPTVTSGVDISGWEFLYKISSPTAIQKFVSADWIPVDVNGNVSTSITPDPDSFFKAGAKTIAVKKEITESTVSLADLYDFRKVGVWTHIEDTNGNFVSNAVIKPVDIDKNSGYVSYVDHRAPIYRSSGQTEEYLVYIGF